MRARSDSSHLALPSSALGSKRAGLRPRKSALRRHICALGRHVRPSCQPTDRQHLPHLRHLHPDLRRRRRRRGAVPAGDGDGRALLLGVGARAAPEVRAAAVARARAPARVGAPLVRRPDARRRAARAPLARARAVGLLGAVARADVRADRARRLVRQGRLRVRRPPRHRADRVGDAARADADDAEGAGGDRAARGRAGRRHRRARARALRGDGVVPHARGGGAGDAHAVPLRLRADVARALRQLRADARLPAPLRRLVPPPPLARPLAVPPVAPVPRDVLRRLVARLRPPPVRRALRRAGAPPRAVGFPSSRDPISHTPHLPYRCSSSRSGWR